jgi:Leucine-rich repeat (LRR) protein
MTSSQPTPTRSRRRWLQFSLRTLLLVTFLVATACGWFANRLQRAHRQADAIKVLTMAGATVIYAHQLDRDQPFDASKPVTRSSPTAPEFLRRLLGDDFFSSVVAVTKLRSGKHADAAFQALRDLPDVEILVVEGFHESIEGIKVGDQLGYQISPPITDRNIAELASLRGLKQLDISGCREVTDDGIAILKSLPLLERLNLSRCAITGNGIAPVASLKKLRELSLEATKVDDDGLRHISTLPNLRELNLWNTKITSAGLRHLTKLTNLESLEIESEKITDESVAHLSSLTRLKELWPSREFSNRGLESVRKMEGLESLWLEYAQSVTDKGLESLSGLTQLRCLYLHSPSITDAGLKHLSSLTNLDLLALREAPISSAGLAHLANLNNLRRLTLDSSEIDDSGIEIFGRFTRLQELNLDYSRITLSGADRLRLILPQTDISCERRIIREAGR